MKYTFKVFLCCLLFAVVIAANAKAQAKSQWVYTGSNGKLAYKTLPQGDRIMDFSYAGYMGGGVALPSPPVKITLDAMSGDNSNAIQSAIDQVAKMPVVNGFRGAVLLNKGTFDCERAININASGVVLRGSGADDKGTIINMTGSPHVCLTVRNRPVVKNIGKAVAVADAYVPAGTSIFTLTATAGLAVGDTISITKPVAADWVAFMGMDQLTRDGKKQTWITGEISSERVITAITGNKVTVDVPFNDNYDAKYLGAGSVSVSKISTTGMLSQVGFENLRIVSPDQTGTINEKHNGAINLSGLTDGWVKNIDVYNTVNSVSITGSRITVQRLNIIHNLATTGAAKPADLNGSGPQILFDRCTITGDNVFFFATGAKVNGPIVMLNCVFKGNGWIQPHQRWATGLLVDNCEVPGGGIDFMNRGAMGSGHGWAIGWAVAWNCKAKSYMNQQPPGSANWVIGSTGEQQKRDVPFIKGSAIVPEGIYDSYKKPVMPQSLYLSQLKERKGEQAVKNLGY
jgi:hypothetical protein